MMLLCVLCVFCFGCAASQGPKQVTGPDATLARLPSGAQGQTWPSSELRVVVVRPTCDESSKGQRSIDERTTLAILDPERATWIMNARLTDQQGLQLTNQIQRRLVSGELDSDRRSNPGLQARLLCQPELGQSSMVIPHGGWSMLTNSNSSDEASEIRLGILDPQTGEVVGEVAMSVWAARDLMQRLDAAIRSPGS